MNRAINPRLDGGALALMNAISDPRRPWRRAALPCLVQLAICLAAAAQDFSITGATTDAEGRFTVRHTADPAFYYLLRRGEEVTHIVSAVDAALGVPVDGQLADLRATAPAGFYRVLQVPVATPFDTDGDGLDDVWELRHRHPKAALNGADAQEDHDGNGRPDLTDYLTPTAYFAQPSSVVEKGGTGQITVQFSRPFAGRLLFQTGGTALPAFDYALTAGDLVDPGTANIRSVAVSSSEVVLGVDATLASRGDADRQVLLSLVQPADNAYRVGQPSVHALTLRDSTLAVYTMALVFTNGPSLPSQGFAISLHTDSPAAGTVTATLSSAGASLFPASLTAPVEVLDGGQFAFRAGLAGTLRGPTGAQSYAFELAFSPPTSGDRVFVLPAELKIHGLSASGRASIAHGAAFVTQRQPVQP